MKNPNRTAKERRIADGINNKEIVILCDKDKRAINYGNVILSKKEDINIDLLPYDKRKLGYISLYQKIIVVTTIKGGMFPALRLVNENYNNFGLESKKFLILILDNSIEGSERDSFIKENMILGTSLKDYIYIENETEYLKEIDEFIY